MDKATQAQPVKVVYRGREYTLTGRSPHGGYFLERNGRTIHTGPDAKVTPVN